MKNARFIFRLIFLLCVCFIACNLENPIMEKWWEEPDLKPEEPFYVPIIKMLPPEILYKTIVETDYIYETIYEQLPPEVVIQYVPQYFYDHIYETKYVTIKEIVYQEIQRDPTNDEIKEFIKQLPPETVFQYLTDDQIQYIKDQIPPEVYIQQLPPQIWLQSILIADIEYVIFSGDAKLYNVNSPTPGGTSLTTQEKATNDDIIRVMAEALRNKDYMLILHGHANPVTGTSAEAAELTQLSLDRANAVRDRLASVYAAGGEPLDNRITTKGYGGVRTVSMTGSSANSSLNRRVEAILFTIDTAPVSGGG